MNKRLMIPGICNSLILVTLLWSCNSTMGGKPGDGMGAPSPYDVLSLSYMHVITHTDFPATIEGQQVVEIRPKVDGFIEAIYVNEGAVVKKDQLLFRISNPQYEENVRTAEASIKIAEADVLVARMNVSKVTPLVEKDIVSKYELESARYTLQSKEAILAQAKAALANAQTNLSYTYIKSPASGLIGTIPYKAGALVSSSITEPLTTLSDISNVQVYFSINEKLLLDMSHGAPGKGLQMLLDKMPPAELVLADGSSYGLKGKLETASGLVSTETGTVGLKAIFSNPEGILRSGGSAIIRLPQVIDSAFLIPQSATFEILNKRFVYKMIAGNRVLSQTVSSQPTDDGLFLIDKTSLKLDDQIVLSGITKLKDSVQIVPVKVNADSLYQKLTGNNHLK